MNLFSTMKLNGAILPNHFFRSAAWERLATPEGRLTPELEAIYEELAKGGVGGIVMSFTRISEEECPLPGMLGIYNDSFVSAYADLARRIHAYGSKVFMQIGYGGSAGFPNEDGGVVWGPSPVRDPKSGILPKEMSEEDIRRCIRLFADAAERAKAAGLDGVQLHAAHGYLLSQFLSPARNRRGDPYGGSVENRTRMIREICQAVRERVGAAYPILIKINSSDAEAGGLTEKDSLLACKLLAEAGIDGFEVSGPDQSRTGILASIELESYFRDFAMRLAGEVDAPVILTGGNRHLNVMNDIAQRSNVQGFGFARPLICEPGLINEWKNGRQTGARCVACGRCRQGRCTVFEQPSDKNGR